MTRIETLAIALLRYEEDAPHVGPNASATYPNWDLSILADWSMSPHDAGACIERPRRCFRCAADEAMHKANWLLMTLADKDS